MAEPFNVHNLSCSTCLQQGFRCPAFQFDGEHGPVCVFHVDGDPCPHKNGVRVAEPMKTFPGQLKPGPKPKPPAPPIDLPAPTLEPIPLKEKPMNREAPKCKAEDCETLTNSAVGYCAKHYYLSKTKHQGVAPTCSVCGVAVRRDNERRLCKAHRNSNAHRKEPAKKTSKSAKPAKPNPVRSLPDELDATAARVNVSMTEKQLNDVLTGLPLDTKAALLNQWLASN